MRVALVTSIERGGPVEHAISLAGGLSRLGARVSAICATESLASRFAEAGAEPRLLALQPGLDLRGAHRLAAAVQGADVVHAHDRRSGLWTRLRRRSHPSEVRVYTAHGLPEEYLPPFPGRPEATLRSLLAYRGLDAALARRTDAVIAPSQAAADLLVERIGYPVARITVIRNGVEPRTTRRADGGALIGTLSMLEPVKGLGMFVRAAARVAERHPEARFAIFGTGSESGGLRALAHTCGVADRLEFPGYVPAPDALAQLRVFVLCSYMETSGIALLEAMAAGVPAVASAVGGIPENAPPGTVSLVPPGDAAALAGAIDRLLSDPGQAAEQARAARVRVEREGSARSMTEAVYNLYRRLQAARG
jgi:glycosyltransferase involved in cell wall biosynthesis